MDLPLLETPMESLVFRYSVTAAGSPWTWLAVLTAALGFWSIRSVASKSDAPRSLQNHAILGHAATKPAQAQPQPEAEASPESAPAAPRHVGKEEDGHVGFTCKGTFFAAYDCHVDDDGERERKEEGEGNLRDGDGDGVVGVRWGREVMGVRRTGDLGWYRYQDLTALNGSIVRLWEDDRRLASPLSSGRRRPA